MKEITAHKANGLNEAITILALDKPGAGGAHHVYELGGAGATVRLEFQNGPVKETGLNGISNEALLAVVAHRLECFQAGKFASEDNGDALGFTKSALTSLKKRTLKRVQQGVEGRNLPHVETPAQVDTAAAPVGVDPKIQVIFWTHPKWDMKLALPADGSKGSPESYLGTADDPKELVQFEVKEMTPAEYAGMTAFTG